MIMREKNTSTAKFNMSKEEKLELLLTTIVCLIPVLAGIILYNKLPEQIATHWDANGNVNGISSRFVGAIVLPVTLVLLNLIYLVILRLDPKYSNMNGKLKAIMHWIIPFVAIFASGTTLAAGLGMDTHIQITGPMLVGLIFILIGNYLPKTRQSYTMGIKLPWTLRSEENWNRTHRVAGFIWVLGGFLMIVTVFLPYKEVIMLVAIAIMVLIPCIYSYSYYRKELRG